jgi:hypothetical protein
MARSKERMASCKQFGTDYLFSPIVVIIVSLVVSILDGSRYKFLLVFTALLPFIAFTLAAGSFSPRALLFSICYLGIAFVVAWLIPNRMMPQRLDK